MLESCFSCKLHESCILVIFCIEIYQTQISTIEMMEVDLNVLIFVTNLEDIGPFSISAAAWWLKEFVEACISCISPLEFCLYLDTEDMSNEWFYSQKRMIEKWNQEANLDFLIHLGFAKLDQVELTKKKELNWIGFTQIKIDGSKREGCETNWGILKQF